MARPRENEPPEIDLLRREVAALREALELQTAVEALPESFDALVGAVGAEWLAVPLRHVVEVVPRVLLSPLPEAPGHIAGYMRLRGRHVPVLEMGRCWSGQDLPVRLEDRIVVVRHDPGEVRGLLVSEVESVGRIEKASLSAVRPDARGAAWALGFVPQAHRSLLLLSIDRLLGPLAELAVPTGGGATS